MKTYIKKQLFGHFIILVISLVLVLATEGGRDPAILFGMVIGYWFIPGVIWLALAPFVLKDKNS